MAKKNNMADMAKLGYDCEWLYSSEKVEFC